MLGIPIVWNQISEFHFHEFVLWKISFTKKTIKKQQSGEITFSCLFTFQFLSLPFALRNPKVDSIDISVTDWIGKVDPQDYGVWIDYAFLLLLGGIPWQCYYQRVLSSKTSKRAMLLSYGGGLIALIMTAPSVVFGAIARATR